MIFKFQGPSGKEGETLVQAGTQWGENKLGKGIVCLQPSEKQVQEWDSVEQHVVEMANGTGRAERPWESRGLCLLDCGRFLCSRGL